MRQHRNALQADQKPADSFSQRENLLADHFNHVFHINHPLSMIPFRKFALPDDVTGSRVHKREYHAWLPTRVFAVGAITLD